MSTRHFRALIGWAAEHPTPAHGEPQDGISRDREQVPKYSGTRYSVVELLRNIETDWSSQS